LSTFISLERYKEAPATREFTKPARQKSSTSKNSPSDKWNWQETFAEKV
jgi:hypothetical protein